MSTYTKQDIQKLLKYSPNLKPSDIARAMEAKGHIVEGWNDNQDDTPHQGNYGISPSQRSSPQTIGNYSQEYQEDQPNILDRASNAVNKTYESYKELPGVKQFGQAVGTVVGTAGGVIGGVVGGVGNTIANAFDGKPLFEGFGKAVSDTARSTAEFGYGIGKEGAAAAPLGAAGKLVNVPLALSQGYEGGKNVYQGIKEGDMEKGFEGGVQLGTALLGAKGTFAGDKGLLLNRSAIQRSIETTTPPGKAPPPSGPMGTIQRANEAIQSTGDLYPLQHTPSIRQRFGSAVNKVARATESMMSVPDKVMAGAKAPVERFLTSRLVSAYDETLRTTASQGRNEAKSGKSAARFLAEEEIVPRVDDGKLDGFSTVDEELGPKYKAENEAFNRILETEPAMLSLEQARQTALKNIESQKNMGSDYTAMVDHINKEFNTIRELYKGDGTPQRGGDLLMSMKDGNRVKSGAWQRANLDKMTKSQAVKDADYQIGKAWAAQIGEKAQNADTKKMNSRLGDFANAMKILQANHDKKMPKNYIRRGITTGIGFVVGNSPVTRLAGALSGEALARFMMDPSVKSSVINNLLNKLGKSPRGKTIVEQANEIISREEDAAFGRKRLTAPAIQAKGQTPKPELSRFNEQQFNNVLRFGQQGFDRRLLTSPSMKLLDAPYANKKTGLRHPDSGPISLPGSYAGTSKIASQGEAIGRNRDLGFSGPMTKAEMDAARLNKRRH
jgi:hypothetical protein